MTLPPFPSPAVRVGSVCFSRGRLSSVSPTRAGALRVSHTAVGAVTGALLVSLLTGGTAYADGDTRATTPQVQVVLPVVDGGITVVVAPGTPVTNTVPATPPATVGPASPPPSTSSSNEAPEARPAPPPAPTASPRPSSTIAPPSRSADVSPAGTATPGSTTSEDSDASHPPRPQTSAAEPWPALPSARPTFVSPAPRPAPSSTGSIETVSPATKRQPVASSTNPFLLGVFAHSTDRVERFQEKVGRPVDVLGVFPARGSWESIMDTWWLDRAPAGFTGILDVGVPLWQDDGDLATAAQGGYDANWENLGRTIHERYPGSTVRIGWEFNLGGWHHHATEENVEQWKQAFRKASAALKRGGPSLLVTWNPNKGRGDSLADATQAWPGDDVVDIVAIDAYDWWPAYSESSWPEHRDGDQGWKQWVDFARTHGKKFAVPEWGVAPGNDHGGGDNPYYIGVVMDFLAAEHARDGIVHSAVYFDEPDSYIRNSIGDGQVPLAGEALASRLAAPGTRRAKTSGAASESPEARSDSAGAPSPTPEGGGVSTGQDTPGEDDARSELEGDASSAAPWIPTDGHGPVPR